MTCPFWIGVMGEAVETTHFDDDLQRLGRFEQMDELRDELLYCYENTSLTRRGYICHIYGNCSMFCVQQLGGLLSNRLKGCGKALPGWNTGKSV